MLKQFVASLLLAGAGLFVAAGDASAQQTLNFSLGLFTPRGEDARTHGDVLNANRSFLAFDVSDFKSAAVGAEWLVPLGNFVEAGAGVGFSRRTVSSVYANFTDIDGTEIEQDLKIRIVPFTAAVRFVPLGHNNPVQPYLGAGVGVFSWRYSEAGEFIDYADGSVFRDRFVGSGATAGPVVFGGLAFVGGSFGVGGEIRYQSAQGDLPTDQGFSGEKIDLGGFTYSATFKVRF